jgi:RNA polymerase-binding transcription factor DksA
VKLGNFAMELADLRAEQERDAGIARAVAAIRAEGEMICVTCKEEIEPARRLAYPAARRCIECQTRLERKRRRS